MLHLEPWSVQRQIATALLEPPYSVLVPASHNVGKTWLAAALTSWFFDSFPVSACLTTAPTARDVRDLLWREVRLQRQSVGLGGFRGDHAPELWSSPEHYAKGFTAQLGESFQGRHQEFMFFLYDEAVGIGSTFWETMEGMFKPNGKHFRLGTYNPTDTSSQVYQEEQSGRWTVISMSALDHPNIAAELRGEPPPFPTALSLAQVDGWVQKWCNPIAGPERTDSDIEWPPQSGKWYRPGPLAESRMLGRWPSQGVYSVWSAALWLASCRVRVAMNDAWPVQIGCDVARFGDDDTAIHVRKGRCSVHHETHNGWSTTQTAARLRQLCHEHRTGDNERRVPVLVDVGGVGGGVVDQSDGYNFIGVNSSEVASDQDRFKNVRSELWFYIADLAKQNAIDVSHLSQATRDAIGRQLVAPRYTVDAFGRLVVEDKAETKKRLKRSPDDADAFNLAYYTTPKIGERVAGHI